MDDERETNSEARQHGQGERQAAVQTDGPVHGPMKLREPSYVR